MKPLVEKIAHAGASVFVFVVFLFCMIVAAASSFRTSLRLFLG